MREFLEKFPNVKIALNFHAWGPLFITPYNWDARRTNPGMTKKAEAFYRYVFEKAGVPHGYTLGNGAQTIHYTANGEASDWMLHERGIYAMSPELGIDSRYAETFFINNKQTLQDLIVQNSAWIEHTIKLLFEKIKCKLRQSYVRSVSD